MHGLTKVEGSSVYLLLYLNFISCPHCYMSNYVKKKVLGTHRLFKDAKYEKKINNDHFFYSYMDYYLHMYMSIRSDIFCFF